MPPLRHLLLFLCIALQPAFFASGMAQSPESPDIVAALQAKAIADGKSSFGHWGTDPDDYTKWRTHSNRLIPVYSFGTKEAGEGVDLDSYINENSVYRSERGLKRLYGKLPDRTLNPTANYMDQTNIADMQQAAAAAGKKHIILFVFDGMDWETTQAASTYNQKKISYTQGKGTGTHFQEYGANGTAQFGYMVTSPHNDGTTTNPTTQTVDNPGGKVPGGYDASIAGSTPWEQPKDAGYLIVKPADGNARHAFTDSAASATSMTAGVKTFYNAIAVGPSGEQLLTLAHDLQNQDWAVGIVTSVPISHATPASAYAHNVSRKDYQDISRDMLGLPSVSHKTNPLPGLDVVIGCGFGVTAKKGEAQGDNFEAGNLYLADSDLREVSIKNGGRYVTSTPRKGKTGGKRLQRAAKKAAEGGHRLLGYYGLADNDGHLPYQTANGDYKPVAGNKESGAEVYTEEQVNEQPTLAEMTTAALTVLESRKQNFWLMVEAGDVDWANHANNIDNAIGAVNSGDAAFKVITDWVETHSNWDETMLIVTSDHGHMLQMTDPEQLIGVTVENVE